MLVRLVEINSLYYKSFTIVIYYHNDSALYSNTTILANFASAWSVNYNRKVRCKLKCTLNCKLRFEIFIVEATSLRKLV